VSSARASQLLSRIPPADKIAIEVEELFPFGQGWVWRRISMASEHEAWKWANRKKRSRDVRNLCIAVSEGGHVSRFTVKSRFGHRVVVPASVRLLPVGVAS
jgi:hypothetical protein